MDAQDYEDLAFWRKLYLRAASIQSAMVEEITIVKIGGKLINDPALLNNVLDAYAQLPGYRLLVHGGGRKATEISKSLGITPKIIDGRRITDRDTLDIVTMVYAGLTNKNIVATLQSKNVACIGLSGADADIIRSHKRIHPKIDYGYVGDIDRIDANFLLSLLIQNLSPILCPITHDGNGLLLNTNADTIASQVAIALQQHCKTVHLRYCFEFDGVLEDISNPHLTIPQITDDMCQVLRAQGKISEGMLPKLSNALAAARKGVLATICGIDNLHSLSAATKITP